MIHTAQPVSLNIPLPASGAPLARVFAPAIRAAAGRLLKLDHLSRVYGIASASDQARCFSDRALAALGVQLDVAGADRDRVPATGGLVVVANHPYGAVEGLAILSLIRSVRPDVRVLANHLLGALPELHDVSFFVDPFGTSGSARANVRGIVAAMRWVAAGGALIVFPAGEVSHFDIRSREVHDPAWSPTIARVIRHARCVVTPVFVNGHNGPVFQAAGVLHPRLRTLMLPRELANKQGMVLRLDVGSPIAYSRLEQCASDEEMVEYLRHRTYLLRHRVRRDAVAPVGTTRPKACQPIVEELPCELIASELEQLPACQQLTRQGDYVVFYATAEQAPGVVREIGRLREITFRAAGEGTGNACDTDRFDDHYHHLVLWHRGHRQIAGAYRIGQSDQIVRWHGRNGLYTATLFHYDARLLDAMGPALELGRSFVQPRYQREFAPLMLLWKGIGAYLLMHPQYRVLFGPVSISDEYSTASQRMMTTFLERTMLDARLAPLVRPGNPLRGRGARAVACTQATSVDDLVAEVRDVEANDRGLPVLLRQYMKLGGKLLSVSVDRSFSNVVDALICVDLAHTERTMLARYMGPEGAAAFLRRHQNT